MENEGQESTGMSDSDQQNLLNSFFGGSPPAAAASSEGQPQNNADSSLKNEGSKDGGAALPPATPGQTGQPATQTPAPQGQQQTATKPAETIPEGIVGEFFKDDGKGNKVFNAEEAFKAVSLKPEQLFKMEPRPAATAPAPGTETEPAKDPFDVRLEEEQKLREGIQKNFFLWRDNYARAIQEGATPEVAMQYANDQSQKLLNENWQNRDRDLWKEQQKNLRDEVRGEFEQNKLREMAAAVEGRLATELGGPARYNQIMFSPKYGGEVIQHLYEQMTPGTEKLTTEQYTQGLNKFWAKYSSNEKNARFVMDVASARLLREMLPHWSSHIGKQKEKEALRAVAAGGVRTSGMSAAIQKSEEPDEVRKFIMGL